MLSRIVKDSDCHEFKPVLAEIEDTPMNPVGQWALWTLFATVLFFAVWSIVSEVDVVVSAPGKVIPNGHAKILQPLDSGVVAKILVEEGAFVKKDQILMEIDPSTTAPELEANDKNYRYTQLEIERLQATVAGRLFCPRAKQQEADALAAQSDLYLASTSAIAKQLAAREEELKKVDEEARSAAAAKAQNQLLLNVARQKETRFKPVADIIAGEELDRVKNDIITYGGNVEQAEHKLKELEHQQGQLRQEIEKIQYDFRTSNLQELSQKQKVAAELSGKGKELAFKQARQLIKAPADGFIDARYVHTVGGVVTTAEKLFSLIPANTPLVIDAAVSNKDIGFVKEGLPVAIKVDTYDFQKYGMLAGQVKLVARNSHDDERAQLPPDEKGEKKLNQVYEVYVTPVSTTLKVDGRERRLTPGLTVTAEIKVGKRRIIELFIYPLIKYWHEGISVR